MFQSNSIKIKNKYQKENEEILIKYTSLIKRRLDFGEVTKTDLEQSKSRLYSMKSNRIQAEGDFEVSKAFYKKVFGIDPRNLILPQKFPKIPENFDYFKPADASSKIH